MFSKALVAGAAASVSSSRAPTLFALRTFPRQAELERSFIFQKDKLLITDSMEPLKKDHAFLQACRYIRRFQFKHNDVTHEVGELHPQEVIPPGLQLKTVVELLHYLPMNGTAMEPAGKARQLVEWDKAHQFCGECGSQTQSPTADQFCRTCGPCNRMFFPRISPAIVVLIERGEEILMARSPHFPPGVFGLIAGFVEAGETLEQAVHREVLEEVGIEITNLRYFASQPWPRPNELMVGFRADYKSGVIVPDPKEIESAAFYPISALPQTFPGTTSVMHWLLKDFRERQQAVITAHSNDEQRGPRGLHC